MHDHTCRLCSVLTISMATALHFLHRVQATTAALCFSTKTVCSAVLQGWAIETPQGGEISCFHTGHSNHPRATKCVRMEKSQLLHTQGPKSASAFLIFALLNLRFHQWRSARERKRNNVQLTDWRKKSFRLLRFQITFLAAHQEAAIKRP